MGRPRGTQTSRKAFGGAKINCQEEKHQKMKFDNRKLLTLDRKVLKVNIERNRNKLIERGRSAPSDRKISENKKCA